MRQTFALVTLAALLICPPQAFAQKNTPAGSAPAEEPTTAAPESQAGDNGATDFEAFVPPTNGTFTTWEAPPDTALVKRLFALAYPEVCGWALGGSPDFLEPEIYDITYREDYFSEDEPDRLFRLYQLYCSAGAYNVQHVYLAWDEVEGLRALQFAQPSLDIKYVDGNFDGPVESLGIDGFAATLTLTNSFYDEQNQTITSDAKWRGLGDASSSGVYAFKAGSFVLKTYDVDASYDGEINPVRILDYATPQTTASN